MQWGINRDKIRRFEWNIVLCADPETLQALRIETHPYMRLEHLLNEAGIKR